MTRNGSKKRLKSSTESQFVHGPTPTKSTKPAANKDTPPADENPSSEELDTLTNGIDDPTAGLPNGEPDVDGESMPSMETLRTCLRIYKELSHGEAYLKDVAKHLGIPATVLHRRLERFEAYIRSVRDPGFRLAARSRGTKASIVNDPELESIILDMSQMVESWEHLTDKWGDNRPVVRLGMTLVVAKRLMPILTHEFPDVAFDVTQTKPGRLLDLARRRKCDLVLTPVSENLREIDIQAHYLEFPLAILAPRGHWSEIYTRSPSFMWPLATFWNEMVECNDTLCLLPDDPDMYPLPSYPNCEELPRNLRIVRMGSKTLCHAMVSSSHPEKAILTIGEAAFLSDDEHEQIYVVPTQEVVGAPTRFALLRPGRTLSGSPLRTKRIDEIEDRLIALLGQFRREETKEANVTTVKWVYFTTRVGSKHYWSRGRLWWTWHFMGSRFTPDLEDNGLAVDVSGAFIALSDGKPLRYAIRGRATRNRVGQYYLACRSSGPEYDQNVFSCITSSKEQMLNGTLCGVWYGPSTRAERPKGVYDVDAGSGCIIIATEPLTVAELNNISMRHRSQIVDPIRTADDMLPDLPELDLESWPPKED